MDRHITVQGLGENSVAPDRCAIDIRVGAAAPTVGEATATMSAASQAVIEALNSAGASQVSTARFSIRTDHDHQGRPSGFRAEVAVRALADLAGGSGAIASRLVEAAVAAGGDHLSLDNLEFINSEPTASEHEAARQAIATARAKAEVMADAAGVQLGDVVTVEQVTRSAPGPLRFRVAAADAAFEMPVEPGTTTTTVDVRVTFGLR